MLVYGKNVFNELKENPKGIKKVYLSKNFRDKEIIDFIKSNKIAYETVDEKRLDQMESVNHQGIILVTHEYEYHSEEEFYHENVVVILDHLEDPHNFGAIIRTCEAAGIKGIIIPKNRSVSVNATVMKASSGALANMKIAMVNNLVNAIEKYKKQGFFIYGAETDGKDFKEINYSDKVLLVIGSEGEGLSRLVKSACDEIISIPMKGKINSLNASVATGIILYEIIGRS